jgi:hypothetical protein
MSRCQVIFAVTFGVCFEVPEAGTAQHPTLFHTCALPALMFRTLVWKILGRNVNLAIAFPHCKKN